MSNLHIFLNLKKLSNLSKEIKFKQTIFIPSFFIIFVGFLELYL